jgi:hypothetical protein
VRAWVRILLGNPSHHMARHQPDKKRVSALNALDDTGIKRLRATALQAVRRMAEITPSKERGIQAHDHLMVHLLEDIGRTDAVRLSALPADTKQLLEMLEIAAADLDNADFLAGFEHANHTLADVIAAAMVDE